MKDKKTLWAVVGIIILIAGGIFYYQRTKAPQEKVEVVEKAMVKDEKTEEKTEQLKEQPKELPKEQPKEQPKVEVQPEIKEEPRAKTTSFGLVSDPAADCFERSSLTETKPKKCGPSVDISSFESSQIGNELTVKLTLAEELPSAFTVNQANKLTEQENFDLLNTVTGEGEAGFYRLTFISLDQTGKVDKNFGITVHIFETGIMTTTFNKETPESNIANVKIEGRTITVTDTLAFDLKGIQTEFFLAIHGTILEGHDIADLVMNKQ